MSKIEDVRTDLAVLTAKVDGVHEILRALVDQVKVQNGRVRKNENWISAGKVVVSILAAIGGTALALVIGG